MDSKIVLVIGAGALAYMWWKSQGTSSETIPSDAQYVGQLASGQTTTVTGGSVTGPAYIYYSPSTGGTYASSAAPTAAQIAAANAAGGSAGSGTGTGSGTGSSASTQAPTSTPDSPVSSGSLASMYTTLVQKASTDSFFSQVNGVWQGTPYHWNFYLQTLLPAGDTAPDPTQVFPNVDLTQPMPATTYWAAMAPYLTAHLGLSGGRGMGNIPWAWRFAA
jgi:hypothetical protein